MILSVGSFVLTATAVIGMILVGKKLVWGWLFNAGSQVLWLAYGIVTNQYGFALSAVVFFIVHMYNWRKWRQRGKGMLVLEVKPKDQEAIFTSAPTEDSIINTFVHSMVSLAYMPLGSSDSEMQGISLTVSYIPGQVTIEYLGEQQLDGEIDRLITIYFHVDVELDKKESGQ